MHHVASRHQGLSVGAGLRPRGSGLDQVEGLGQFLELEVVLGEGERSENGVREAQRLMDTLGIDASQLIEQAYVDLLGH